MALSTKIAVALFASAGMALAAGVALTQTADVPAQSPASATPAASEAGSFSPAEEARIRELAIQALLDRPEILRELVSRLEAQEAAQAAAQAEAALAELAGPLFNDPNAPSIGPADADITIVEFMDYNCGFCKRAAAEVQQLMEFDDSVRLVFREWPILSPGSAVGARVALAAREQDAYEQVHWALMARQRVTEETALQVASELGLDMDKLRADMQARSVDEHIETSMMLAQSLGVNGTPAFVLEDRVLGGLTPAPELMEMIEEIRASR